MSLYSARKYLVRLSALVCLLSCDAGFKVNTVHQTLALSFFKIPGMSKALLQVLTLPKSIYRRVQTEMGWFEE